MIKKHYLWLGYYSQQFGDSIFAKELKKLSHKMQPNPSRLSYLGYGQIIHTLALRLSMKLRMSYLLSSISDHKNFCTAGGSVFFG
jgi:hypothetical protein